MSELAPPLRPWSTWLEPLVPDLAVGLGPMVERLAEVLGPMPPRPEPGAVEPDGLSGLDRRGPYERLLLTEWALAEELPDEFLRRAASHEHLFLQLERTGPRAGRRCVVVFDAGPDQVGSPRLAHLALLPVFARRAEEAEATLVWGPLQRPGTQRADVSATSYPALLADRIAERPTPAHHAAWAQHLELKDRDEVWVVGGPGARRGAPANAVHVEVAEVLDTGPDELLVTVRRPGRPARELRLPLPPPEACAALIRAPLRPPQVPAPRPPTTRGTYPTPLLPSLRFSGDGWRLLCQEVDGTVVAFKTPGQVEPRRRPRRLSLQIPRTTPLALGWGRRSILLFEHTRDGHFLSGGRYNHRWPGPPLPAATTPSELVVTTQAGADTVWFRDAQQNLWCWSVGRSAVAPVPGALALGRRDGRVLQVLAEEGRTRVVRGPPADRDAGHQTEVTVPFRAEAAHIGSAIGVGVGTVLLEGADRWEFAPSHGRAPTTHDPVPGVRVVGAWGGLHGDRGVLYLKGELLVSRRLEPELGPEEVLPARGPVVAAAASPTHYARLCAWMEASGRVVFHRPDGVLQTIEPPEPTP